MKKDYPEQLKSIPNGILLFNHALVDIREFNEKFNSKPQSTRVTYLKRRITKCKKDIEHGDKFYNFRYKLVLKYLNDLLNKTSQERSW